VRGRVPNTTARVTFEIADAVGRRSKINVPLQYLGLYNMDWGWICRSFFFFFSFLSFFLSFFPFYPHMQKFFKIYRPIVFFLFLTEGWKFEELSGSRKYTASAPHDDTMM